MKYAVMLCGALMVLGTSMAAAQEAACKDQTPQALQATAWTSDSLHKPAMFMRGPDPKYPSELRKAKVTGKVTLSFVVGTDGKAEKCSMSVVQSTNAGFEAPSIQTILGATFTPAEANGVKVRQVVTQSVNYFLGN